MSNSLKVANRSSFSTTTRTLLFEPPRSCRRLICLAKLTVFPFQGRHVLIHLRGNTCALTAVPFDLSGPFIESLGHTTNLPAIDTIAAQRDVCSPSCSRTIRTARAQT